MIQVGFAIRGDSGWMGGLRYFESLLSAVMDFSEREIDPVLVIGKKDLPTLPWRSGLVSELRTSFLDRGSPPWAWRKGVDKISGRDFAFDRFLARNGIRVLSHSGSLGEGSRTATTAWIPDFQHRRMPEFFDAAELSTRDRTYSKYLKECTRVIVSSASALADLREFCPEYASKARVLRFAVKPPQVKELVPLSELQKIYGFSKPYLYLPNQFWAHKNHEVVIQALAELKGRGKEALVVATGNTKDYRQPDHFAKLSELVKKRNLEENFRILGMVPYAHVVSLMHFAEGLINPSFFEGWSTTVEEAKSLGKRILLSDIDVHREQAPALGAYFDPKDDKACAEGIWELLEARPSEQTCRNWAESARADLSQRWKNFAASYQSIVTEAANERDP